MAEDLDIFQLKGRTITEVTAMDNGTKTSFMCLVLTLDNGKECSFSSISNEANSSCNWKHNAIDFSIKDAE
jgi:hypothetical protein